MGTNENHANKIIKWRFYKLKYPEAGEQKYIQLLLVLSYFGQQISTMNIHFSPPARVQLHIVVGVVLIHCYASRPDLYQTLYTQ